MKTALAFLTVFISSAMPVAAQQTPETAPKQWSVSIRFYGTTSMPGRDDLQIYVHTTGSQPASLRTRRPVNDELGKMSSNSPEDNRKLSDATRTAIYSSARSVIQKHRIGEEPDMKVADGDSVEITISSFDRKLSAVFDHSSALNSEEFKKLIEVLHAELPKDFQLRRVSENEKVDSTIRQAAPKAVGQIERRSEASPPGKRQAEAIRKLEFLVGTWESVEPENTPPAPETRTIALQPDGLSLTVTTESVLGKSRPVQITFDQESQEYLLTHTNADGETRVFKAKLIDDSKLKIPIPESALFSGLDFIVSVNDGQWTETIRQPSRPSEMLYQRSFVRQHHDPLRAKP